MTTPATDHNANASLIEPPPTSRWGIRLRELAAEAAASPPAPVDWEPKPSVSQRLRRGTAVPIAAAAAVFIAIVLISIATVWLRPHSVEQDPAALGAVQIAGPPGEGTGETGGTGGNGAHGAAPAGNDPGGVSRDSGSGSGSGPLSTLYVHVVGEVNQPGVYELEPGSRALAAIEAAGGATAHAVLSGLNLARPLSDGEQLIVPNAEQMQTAAASGSGGASLNLNAASDGLVSLNAADQTALESLPRVGPALAQRIIEWRSANGGFQSVEQLLNISGIGQKTFEHLSDLVTL